MRAAVSLTTRSPSRKPRTPRRLRDGAAELVAEDHRHVHRPRVRVARLVHVRAAHRYRADLEQHLVVGNRRNGNLTELHRERREGVVNHGGLCRHDGVGTRFGDSDRSRGGSRGVNGVDGPGHTVPRPRPRIPDAVRSGSDDGRHELECRGSRPGKIGAGEAVALAGYLRSDSRAPPPSPRPQIADQAQGLAIGTIGSSVP